MSEVAVEALREAYDLDPETIGRFQRDGFVKLEDVLAPEALDVLGEEITRKVFELNTEDLPIGERTAFRAAFLQVFNLWTHSDGAKELIFSPRLARIATELMGVRAVRLYHDQALYKEPGGLTTPWHADQYYWPFETPNTITAWIPFQAVPVEMGPLSFSAGSHVIEIGRDLPISEESERVISDALRERNLPYVEEPFALGDVSFHSGWTFHRAPANMTAEPRRVQTIIYVDADAPIAEPTSDAQRKDLARWLEGSAPGQLATGPLNPVLYSIQETSSP
jgi:hypothetical protein